MEKIFDIMFDIQAINGVPRKCRNRNGNLMTQNGKRI